MDGPRFTRAFKPSFRLCQNHFCYFVIYDSKCGVGCLKLFAYRVHCREHVVCDFALTVVSRRGLLRPWRRSRSGKGRCLGHTEGPLRILLKGPHVNALKLIKKGERASYRGVAVISAKIHKRQSVTAIREKLQTPKVLTAILTLPNLTELNLT